MANHEQMMILEPEKRRQYFRECYALELGKLVAAGKTMWPKERFPEMVERVSQALLKRQAPAGPAFDATMKFFGLKTQKALWTFLGV